MSDPIVKIQQQAQQAKTKIKTWRTQQSKAVETEAEKMRCEQTDVASDIEKQSQRTLEEIRKQETKAKRAKEIPGITIAKPEAGLAKEVEKTRKEAIQKTIKGKEELKEAKKEALEEIATTAEESLIDIDKQEKLAVTEFKEFAADNVQLDYINPETGENEWTDKDTFKDLSEDDQKLIVKVGIKQFNEIKAKEQEEFKSENVELDYVNPNTNEHEWMDKEAYDAITDKEAKEILNTKGIDAYNDYMKENQEAQQQAVYDSYSEYPAVQAAIDAGGYGVLDLSDLTPEKQFAQYQVWGMIPEEATFAGVSSTGDITYNTLPEGDNVQIDYEDEYVNEEWYNSLEKDNQKELNEIGHKAYMKKHYVELNYINPTTGEKELVDREWYYSLTTNQMAQVSTNGTQAYFKEHYVTLNYVNPTTGEKEIVDKEWYESLPTDTTEDRLRRQYLSDNGVEAWQKKYYVQLGSTEEYITREFYDNIGVETVDGIERQSYLKNNGLTAYYDKYYVKLEKTDELIPRVSYTDKEGNFITGYDDMSTEYQDILQSQGADGLRTHQETLQTEFETNNIQVGTGDNAGWIPRKSYTDTDGNKVTGYDDLSKDDQQLIMSLGVVQYGQAKDQEVEDYFNSLCPEAKNWIAEHSRESFTRYLERMEKAKSDRAFYIAKQIGIIDKNAEYVGEDENGSFTYYIPAPSAKTAKVIDLKNIDYDNNLTIQDYYNIALTASKDPRYQIMEEAPLPWIESKPSLQFSLLRYADSLPKEQKDILMALATKIHQEQDIEAISTIFPPAEILRPEVTFESYWNSPGGKTGWAIGIAQIGLGMAGPALGAIGKAAGIIGKVATVAGRIVKLASTITFPIVTAVEWEDMTDTQRRVAVALNIGMVGALYGKTAFKGIKALSSKISTKLFSRSTKIIGQLSKAVKAGNVTAIKTAAIKLEKLGTSIMKKDPVQGRVLQEQARFFSRFADDIIAQAKVTPKGTAKLINKLGARVAKAIKTGEAGGMEPIRPEVKKVAKEWVKRGTITKGAAEVGMSEVDFAGFIKARVANPKLTPLEYLISKVSVKPAGKTTFDVFDRALMELDFAKIAKRGKLAITKLAKIAKVKAADAKVIADASKIAKVNVVKVANWSKVKQNWIKEMQRVANKQLGLNQLTSGLTKSELTAIKAIKEKALEAILKTVEVANPNLYITNANRMLTVLLDNNMVTVAMAYSTTNVIKALERTNTITQAKVLKVLSPDIRSAVIVSIDKAVASSVRTKAIANVETLAQDAVKTYAQTIAKASTKAQAETQILTQSQVKVITSAATEAATKALTEGATLVETKAVTKIVVDELVKTITVPATKTIVKTKINEIIDVVIKQISKIKPHSKPGKFFKLPKIKLPDGTEHQMTEEEFASAVGWKQGIMYIMIYKPYKQNNITFTRKSIAGISYMEGARSAYESIRKLKDGKLPAKVKIDLGIMDVIIETKKAGRGKPKLKFKRDVEQISSKGISTTK